ncbi:MurR/RpiR family transcriptional regulator [Streptococcus sp. H49]|uniref:MurR/RpiR family transcriptional regulator n=1 Tax=Streptococcus huangxiaojuni TaxID=3237239 RepID=UPI0034A0D603
MEEIHKENQTFSHIDPDIPFKISDSNLTIAAKIAQVQTASVEDSLALLNEEALVSAAYSLKKADRVVVFGISPNNILAKIFRRRLSAIGKQIDVPLQDEMGLTALSLTDRDLAIFISYSGHLTQFPSKIMTYLTENQVTRLAITSQKHSPLAEACDLFLALSAREQVVGKISSFASEESILFVLNVLYAVYFALDYKDNMAYKQRMTELLEKGRLQ